MQIEPLTIVGNPYKKQPNKDVLWHWDKAIIIPGKNPLVLDNGEVKEFMGTSCASEMLNEPLITLRVTPRCKSKEAKLLLGKKHPA